MFRTWLVVNTIFHTWRILSTVSLGRMCIKGLTGRIRRGVDAARHPPHPAGSVPSPSGTGWLNYEKYTISLSLETFIKKKVFQIFRLPLFKVEYGL